MRNTRDFGLKNNGAGKGDSDRSPGWRAHYNEINWGPDHDTGGVKRFRKVYGQTATVKNSEAPHVRIK
jgi:hypothetical protein